MTSSSSSGSGAGSQSDDDAFAAAALRPRPPAAGERPADLNAVLELAQIAHFCATFRAPLKLSRFTRTELQAALVNGANPNESQLALLAELHFKLARDQTGVKMERMIQDWEKAVARKLGENWQLAFAFNPMANSTSYAELSVLDRIHILNALCLWKAESCVEIRKYIATIQKDDAKAFDRLRGSEIGTDDKGVSYWYFDDGCWVYAEDKPQWQLEQREPLYICEFANGKRIRLSINFDADAVNSADRQPFPLTTKVVSVKDILAPSSSNKVETQEAADVVAKAAPVPKKEEEIVPDQTEKRAKFSILNEEKEEISLPCGAVSVAKSTAQVDENLPSAAAESAVKDEEPARPVSRKMDIMMICGSPSSDDNMSAKSEPMEKTTSTGNGIVKIVAFASNGAIKSEEKPNGIAKATTTALVAQPIEEEDSKPLMTILKAEIKENQVEIEAAQDVGSKKRVIIDDDHTDSSDTEAAKKAEGREATVKQTISSPPPQKKQKTEASDAVKVQSEASSTEKAKPSTPKVFIDTAALAKAIEVDVKTAESADKVTKKTEENAVAEPNGAAPDTATSTTADLTATENFDINCECCLKDYDMRYLDPPLVERPAGEWRCFECLVNDARGWPRRRKSTASPTSKTEATDEKPKSTLSSSSKKRSSSSSAKRSRPSSSKSSSSKTTTPTNATTSSSGSKRKKSSSSGGGNSTSKKSSSSSSKKKHKKKKSSSSSSHHHRSSSSSSHHRRRHHQEYSKLLVTFRARNKERLSIEEQRINDVSRHSAEMLDSPTSWRVVSSTLDSLRVLIETLTGGSLEQERLRSWLISILKTQEKLEEERIKRQELVWQILPRRQSSRIAIGRMRSHSSGSDGSEDEFSEEEGAGGKSSRRGGAQRSSTRGTRTAEAGANCGGVDSKEQLALERASRLRRRKAQEEMDDHGDNNDGDHEDEDEDDAPLSSVSQPGDWINWSILRGNKRTLSMVGLAAVDRLLKEEISELFARPVDPEFDGCPDYLTIITHPMDLGTIRTRLETGSYKKWENFKSDVQRVWENCRVFNGADTLISQYADTLGALFKQMCKAAEKRGARTMTDNGDSNTVDNNGDASDEDEPHHSSSSGDESKAESRTSVNKEWTESSESESSGSSDDDDDSDGSSDEKAKRSSRSRASGGKKPPSTRRPSPKSSAAAARSSRTRARPATTKTKTKRRAQKSDDDDEDDESEALSSSDDSDDASNRRRRAKQTTSNNVVLTRATRTHTAGFGRQVSPLSGQKSTKSTASSAQQASPKANRVKKSAPPVSPPPPPPPPPSVPLDAKQQQQQKSPATEKSPRLAASRPSRLRVSDDSSSSDSDDDKGSSSSSSTSSSDDSADSDDSDDDLCAPPPPQPKEPSPAPPAPPAKKARAAIAPPLPPLGKPESAPPPPPSSPPRGSSAANQLPPPPPKDNGAARPAKAKRSSNATNSKKSKVSPRVAALTLDRVGSGAGLANSSYANSPTLLNSYLSPSSSSSSYFSSSAESDSSDNNDSDSDDAGSD